ncbi:MAG: hypothetical protein JNN20_03435 [Betaproteobacteria bacterium]|nr:hypothetical protein [Betaproteobacteria bacterium]
MELVVLRVGRIAWPIEIQVIATGVGLVRHRHMGHVAVVSHLVREALGAHAPAAHACDETGEERNDDSMAKRREHASDSNALAGRRKKDRLRKLDEVNTRGLPISAVTLEPHHDHCEKRRLEKTKAAWLGGFFVLRYNEGRQPHINFDSESYTSTLLSTSWHLLNQPIVLMIDERNIQKMT